MNKQSSFATALYIAVFVIGLAGIYGWCWNIVKLLGMSSDHVTGMMVARAIGVFVAPLGAVLGFC